MTEAKLLSGDNPKIPKGYGDEHVAAFLDAVPGTGLGGWKNAACRAIDEVISREVPGVRKAVKWNTPMYAASDADSRDHFFCSFHCFTKYVKVGFNRGDDLSPPPPEPSKHGGMRYYHVTEADLEGEIAQGSFAKWVRQAAKLPGEKM